MILPPVPPGMLSPGTILISTLFTEAPEQPAGMGDGLVRFPFPPFEPPPAPHAAATATSAEHDAASNSRWDMRIYWRFSAKVARGPGLVRTPVIRAEVNVPVATALTGRGPLPMGDAITVAKANVLPLTVPVSAPV